MHIEEVTEFTDRELLALIRQDDRMAYERIYNKYWSKLYLSAYNILRNRQHAEDIVQEVMVQLWLKRGITQIDTLNAYLYTAVRFQVFKAIRAGKVREGLFEELEGISLENIVRAEHVENEADQHLLESDINNSLEKGIALLPDKCREIFLLSRKEQLTNKEIAERLGISVKTVENQMTIALRKLKAAMGDVLFWAAVFLADFWR